MRNLTGFERIKIKRHTNGVSFALVKKTVLL